MNRKGRYYVEPQDALTLLAMALMAAAGIIRIIWWVLWPQELTTVWTTVTQGVLPLVAAALFLLLTPLLGKRALWTTSIPVFMGVIFFITKAAGFAWWHQLLCTALYLLVAALYSLTVFGILPTQRLLIPLFGLPFIYHLVVQDLIQNLHVYSASQWLREISVLCIMAGLLSLSAGMRRTDSKSAVKS